VDGARHGRPGGPRTLSAGSGGHPFGCTFRLSGSSRSCGYYVGPGGTVRDATATDAVLAVSLVALGVRAVLLVPSIWGLHRTFQRALPVEDSDVRTEPPGSPQRWAADTAAVRASVLMPTSLPLTLMVGVPFTPALEASSVTDFVQVA